MPLNVLLLFVFFSQISSSSWYLLSILLHSGRAHGAFAAALVDGDGLYSLGNGELRLAHLPPLGHHHLLQGHQKVGFFFAKLFLFSLVPVLDDFRSDGAKHWPLNALLVI